MAGFRKFASYTAVVLLLLNVLIGPAVAAGVAKTTPPQLLYRIQDPVGDDRGPGSYKDPISPIFSPRKGLFDLLNFSVYADANNYYFDMEMGAMSNPWGAPEGFSHQRIAIYIDSVANQGKTETLQEGAFVDFPSQYAWDYLIDIKGWDHSRMFYHTDMKDATGIKAGLTVSLLPKTKVIEARVARKLLDEHPDTWAFYVLVGSQDGLGPDGFRQVLAKATAWQFGGGTDTYFDPNVIDMLDTGVKPRAQYDMLRSYSVQKGKLALIYPVIPPKPLHSLPSQPTWLETEAGSLFAPITALLAVYPWAKYKPLYITGFLIVLIVTLLVVLNWNRLSNRFRRKE